MSDLVKELLRWKADWQLTDEHIISKVAHELERLEKEIVGAENVCDSYAAESQRFHDEIERLTKQVTEWVRQAENNSGEAQRWALEVEALRNQLVSAREALKPFAHSGWMTGDTERTNRTVVAHMHPEMEYRIILCSDDFRRAEAVLTAEPKP